MQHIRVSEAASSFTCDKDAFWTSCCDITSIITVTRVQAAIYPPDVKPQPRAAACYIGSHVVRNKLYSED